MILLFCFQHIFKILNTVLSFCPLSSNETTLAAHTDKSYSDSLPETSPKGEGKTKNSVSQTVTLIHGVQIDLSTVRIRYSDREREWDTQRGHPSMPLQEMDSSSWDWTGEACLKRAASARALGSRCENSPPELPHSSVITSF